MFIRHPYVLLTVTALFWGGNAVAGKLAAGHISPFLLTSLRWLVCCLIMLPIAYPYLRREWKIIRQHFVFLALLGATGFTVFNNLMYLALNYTSAINVSIEQASMPLMVFVLNFLLYRIHTTRHQIIGFAITLIGVAVTVTRGEMAGLTGRSLNIGDLLMIAAIMFYGIYSVLLKNKPDIHIWSLFGTLAPCALIASIPFTAYEYLSGSLQLPDVQGAGVVLYTAIFPSIVSQLFWIAGLAAVGSNRGGVFINLVPVFGAILSILILGERFQLYHAIGMVLVIGGVWLAQRATVSPGPEPR